MGTFLNILIWVLLLITGRLMYKSYEENKQRKRALIGFYKAKLNAIRNAATEFENHVDFQSGYFTNYQLTVWKNKWVNLFNEIKEQEFEDINLQADEVSSIRTFNDYFTSAISRRDDFNKRFIAEELKRYQAFFENIEGRKLDQQQRTAVVVDEDNNMVIAGAGSGKTTTIVGKVNYVIDRYKIAPEEILLISFTNKSAATLAERINIKGVEAKTFHKLGKDTIVKVEGKQPSLFDENQFKPLVTKYFEEFSKDKTYLNKVTEYFNNFLKPAKSQFEFDDHGKYIQYIKDQNFRTYKLKEVSTKERTTYKMEVVKSIEECQIANFLLFNNIEYEYEYPYEFDTATEAFRQYKPDFTIKQNGKKIYLEHFAVARNGSVPKFFAKETETPELAKKRYWEKIEWARELHRGNKTALIETYSYEMSEGILFDNLSQHLTENGIIVTPKSPGEIWEIIGNAAADEVNSFITLFGTFITLMKSNNYSINDLTNKNKQTESEFFKKRNALFIEIIRPIYEQYQNYLAGRKEIDFSDMINHASQYISSGKHQTKYRYVIIDEFQDISIGRYQLVKAIKEQNPACKLFCVGDDWQSIYRFSGSDISLFKGFETYFGVNVTSRIETTYRFYNPVIKLSSDFIQRNPNQAKKELKGLPGVQKNTNYKIHYSISENQDDTNALQNVLDELVNSIPNIHENEIFILGRYSFDINRIKNENEVFKIENEVITYKASTATGTKTLRAHFLTIHKSKGLEANIVIVLNCNSGQHGFPSELSDDPVLNLLLSEGDQFENGEERRLFYVAMTRAKEMVYFIADKFSKSKFISELETESGKSPNRKCPSCKTADLVLRRSGKAKNGNKYNFYGCSNYLYGCEYTTTDWQN